MNAWLFHRQLRARLAQQGNGSDSHQAPQAMGRIVTTHSACQRLTLEQLMTRFVLHRAQRALHDRTSANDVELKQFGMSMLLLLTEVCVPRTAWLSALRESAVGRSFAQDLPFFVLSTILLIRTVNRKFDAAVLAPNRFCSPQYGTNFILLFLNTMKTAGMLATKLVKLKSLPSIWSKRLKLQAEQGKLAQRVARLESVEMAALAAAAPADDDDACAEGAQGAAPAVGGSAQPPEHRGTVAACPASDAGSSSTPSLPLVSLSVRFTESAFGEGGFELVGRMCMCRDRVRASDHATMPEPPSAAQRSSARGQRRPATPPRPHGRCARGAMIRLPTQRHDST
jgi:hypothetical protein